MRLARSGARKRGDVGWEDGVDPKRRCLVDDVRDLAPVMPCGFLRGQGPPPNPEQPRALACLTPRDSELASLVRSLIRLSPSPPPPDAGKKVRRRLVLTFCINSTGLGGGPGPHA